MLKYLGLCVPRSADYFTVGSQTSVGCGGKRKCGSTAIGELELKEVDFYCFSLSVFYRFDRF